MTTTATKDSKELYSGKANALTFEKFDDKVLRWCRKEFGDSYAKALWKNTITPLVNLDLNDDTDNFTFEMHCAKVYDVVSLKSPKNADHLMQSDRFQKNGKWNSGKHVVMTVAEILKEAEEKLKDVPADEDPFWFYTRSTTSNEEDRAPSSFFTALAAKEEGEESLSQSSETSESSFFDEAEVASCATHSPVYSPCPSLSDEPAESENTNTLTEQTVYPNDSIVENQAWNPTPQWGT
jgi:hypothetical protein